MIWILVAVIIGPGYVHVGPEPMPNQTTFSRQFESYDECNDRVKYLRGTIPAAAQIKFHCTVIPTE